MTNTKGKTAYEVNFDGIVGPTHNYGGLSFGNIASEKHKNLISHPKEAALQGLEKMKCLADKGLKQCVLPPHERPHLPTLRALGFAGNDASTISLAALTAPNLLCEVTSASAMWTANAATICPSWDSVDGKVHMTPANLASTFHRSIEAKTTSVILKKVFNNARYFEHHSPLPGGCQFSDEGAANHTRFCREDGAGGIHLFVYGRKGLSTTQDTPSRYPARQSFEASEAIVRLHGLTEDSVVYAQQHPKAIDAGAFHNDVVSVGHKNLFFFHEEAFKNRERVLGEIASKFKAKNGSEIHFLEVKSEQVSLEEAIATYLFNSQILTLPTNSTLLLAPIECRENIKIHSYLQELIASGNSGIDKIEYVNLRQSMNNGGGPACLRLRVVLTPEEWDSIHPGVILNEKLYIDLKNWINNHYRDEIKPTDLTHPTLYNESCEALDELTKILGIGAIYEFQQT